MANLVIKVSGSHTAQQIRDSLAFSPKSTAKDFLKSISKAVVDSANVELQLLNDNASSATTTVVIDNSKIAANDTLTIGDIVYTAKASGATGHQFNIAGSATLTGDNLTALINNNAATDFGGYLNAVNNAGTITLTVTKAGFLGNLIATSATVGVSGAIVPAGTRFGSGAEDSASSISYKKW